MGLKGIQKSWSFGEEEGRAFPERERDESRQGSLCAHEVCGHYCAMAKQQQVFFPSWEQVSVVKYLHQIWEN